MSETPETDALRKAISRLTLAVWFVAVGVFLLAGFYSVMLFFPTTYMSGFSDVAMNGEPVSSNPRQSRTSSFEDIVNFAELPIEEQIANASVIAIMRYEDSDGERLVAIVSEILKRSPGTDFHYDIGQEYPMASRRKEENTSYGDGVLVFFSGSRPSFRYSTSFEDNRIRGFGDMPLDRFRVLMQSEDDESRN